MKQLVEIAETVLVQEWSELKDNQRLDFFVLLYQDKRTKKIRSDFLSDNSVSFTKIELYLSQLIFCQT